jgi:hypothetical protein
MRAASVTAVAGLAGCTGGNLFEVQSSSTSIPSVPENRPNAVYFPSHVEGMQMLGMSGMGNMNGMNSSDGMNGSSTMTSMNRSNDSEGMGKTSSTGDYAFGLMYSYPHRFWTVTGTERSKTALQDADSLHLMGSVWNPASGTVLPDTGLSVEITQDDELVSQEVIYPMLSQQMGFHYGANFELPGDGTYTAKLSVGAMNTRRTGAFQGMFTKPQSAEIKFEYAEQKMNEISYRVLEEKAGTKGAIEPMNMKMMPQAYAPKKADLPDRIIGEVTSGDARFLVTQLQSPPAGVKGETYLAASVRTPYNRLVIPAMALSGTLQRGGKTVFDGELKRTLDPDLNYHYGTALESIQSGDELTISADTPPQVARHEGYETAFLGEMTEMTLTVP